MVTGGWVLFKKEKTMKFVQPHGPNSNFFWPQNTVAGLKITMFSLSNMHLLPRQVKHIKYYQIYYPKLKINRSRYSH
jgi:hypothetical protein